MIGALKSSLYEMVVFVANHVVSHLPSRRIRRAYYRRAINAEIGSGSAIALGAKFNSRQRFRMGRHSVINENCRLDNRGGIWIGDNVSISAEVIILTADHDVRDPDFTGRTRPVEIKEYAFIGTRSLILPGVRIGVGAVVAAGSVVTRSVGDYAIVAGNPARVIGQRPADMGYEIFYDRFLH
jgi:acetyltransferase-like isoleucine patch superfamily enzyme